MPQTYTSVACPVEGCPGRATSHTNLWLNFIHWYVEHISIILNEGTGPQPQCGQCDMLMPQEILSSGHLSIKTFRRGAEQKRCRIAANVAWSAAGTEFRSHDNFHDKVGTFKYLGRMLSSDDIYCPSVTQNLYIAWSKWGRLSCLLGHERTYTSTSGSFYVEVVQ